MPNDSDQSVGRRTFLKATGAAGAAAAVGASNVTMAREPDADPASTILIATYATTEMSTAEVAVQDVLPSEADVFWKSDMMNVMAADMPDRISTQAIHRTITQLEQEEIVKFAEVDKDRSEIHSVDDPRLDEQYAPQQTNATEVWNQEGFLGSEDIEVAIFDTGVQYDHPNLQSRFGRNKGIAPGDRGTDDPMDERRHGTHVAGIASATTDNGRGHAGMSNSRLWAVKIFPNASSRTTIESLEWAIEQGVDVVNGSYGGGRPSDAERQAFQNALDNGILPFFSAGNDGPGGDTVSYPGAYSETICVSALEEGEDIARFSSRGPEVDITGPGAQVLSTVPTDGYQRLSGTSMSSPAVAGTTALAWGAAPELSNTEVRATLFETAVDVGLPETQQGNGRADAKKMYDEFDGGPPGDNSVTFNDQILGSDGAVTVNVTSAQASTLAVTYEDGDQNVIAGLAAADNVSDAEVDVAIEDAGGFPGTHTAWLFDDADVPGGVGIGDDATPIAGAALDSDSAEVSDEPDEPKAIIQASATEPSVGEEVELDGTESTSPNGEITEYQWTANGESATGPTVTISRDQPTTVDVTLEITDEAGQTATDSTTIEFVDDGANCGAEDYTGSADGTIYWFNNSDTYSFSTQTSNPCQVTFDLDGPSTSDFDLFVTFDGRTPTPNDFDASSTSPDGNETIVVDVPEDVSSVDFGILVQGISGWGRYTISVEELGF